MSTSGSFNHDFRTETWCLYTVGICLTLTRLISQAKRLGIRNLRADDWLIMTTIPWYTMLVVSINEIIFGGGSNYMTSQEIAELTPEAYEARVSGSKWVLVSEEMMVLTVWTCKVSMILIYKRLTQGLIQSRVVDGILVYSIVGFVASQIAFFSECRPFTGYWSVPAISDQCWSYYDFEIVVAVFHISSDIILLAVALPLIIPLQIPVQQKVILILVFGMGVFVIIAAILTKLFSLDPDLVSYAYLSWFMREASVSLYIVNLPGLWAFLRDMFPMVKSWGYKSMSPNVPNDSTLHLTPLNRGDSIRTNQ